MSNAQQLHELLADGSEINIVCHNNPDPDCLASALALARIAAAADIDERHILYSGDISHQQNRAFVNLLDIDIQPFESATVRDIRLAGVAARCSAATPPFEVTSFSSGDDHEIISMTRSSRSITEQDLKHKELRRTKGIDK